MRDAAAVGWEHPMPEPVIPVPPDLGGAGLAGLIAGAAALVGALSRDFFAFLKDRREGRDQAAFRHELLADVQRLGGKVGGLEAQIGTYEDQVDELERKVFDLTGANARILKQFEEATADGLKLIAQIQALTRRVAKLTSLLLDHGIPVPEDE